MLRDTADRVAATIVVGVVLWVVARRLGVPEAVELAVIPVVAGVSHGLTGLWPLRRAAAVAPGIHELDTDKPAWLEVVPDEPWRPTRVVGCALAEPVWDRLVLAAETAASGAGIKPPGVMIGQRMRDRYVFAAGPWRRDTTLCVDLDVLDPERADELAGRLAGELRWVRARLPLWGTLAAGAVLEGTRAALGGWSVL